MFTHDDLTNLLKYRVTGVVAAGAALAAVAALAAAPSASAAPAAPQSPGFNVSITATQSRVALGTRVTLTATTDHVMNGQNYFLRLTNDSTGTVLAQCTLGTTCTASYGLDLSATQTFSAHLDAGLGGPAPYPVLSSATTTVQWKVPTINLINTAYDSPGNSYTTRIIASGRTVYLLAQTDVSLTGSNYFVSVRDVVGGELKRCTTGTACLTSATFPNYHVGDFVAHLDSRFAHNGLYPTVAQSSVEGVAWLTTMRLNLSELDAGDVSVYGVQLTASRDGSWSLTGTLYDGGTLFGDNYAYGFAWNGLGHGAAQAGNIAHHNHDPLDQHGTDPWIAANWSHVVGNAVTSHLSASSDIWDQLGAVWSYLEPYAGDALTWLLTA